MSATWYCCRQRAGPLVKECRALRPRFAPDDTDADHAGKAELKRKQNGTLDRKQVDRLELRLALIGRTALMYTLTFDSAHIPGDFRGVRRALERFFKLVKRHRAACGKEPAFDYIFLLRPGSADVPRASGMRPDNSRTGLLTRRAGATPAGRKEGNMLWKSARR